MCNRFSLTADLPDLMEDFRIDRVHIPYSRRYNIAPTQTIPVVQRRGDERCLDQQRWGLMPFWGKSSVNVDIASLGEKPYLRRMLKNNRCVVPCSGFYIWRQEGKLRRPWRVVHRKKAIFAMAGLFDVWLDSEKKEFPMCTVITAGYAERSSDALPLILEEADIGAWLEPRDIRPDALHSLLRPLRPEELRMYPVTPLMDNSSYEKPECIRELDGSFPLIKV